MGQTEKIETEVSSLPSPEVADGALGERKSTSLKSRFHSRLSDTTVTTILGIVILGFFAVLVLFIQTTYAAESRSRQGHALDGLLKTDVSTTLAILRASQGILSALTAVALNDAFVFLQWAMINSPDGLHYLSLLALSPTTWNFGTLALVCSSAATLTPKFWALLRHAYPQRC